MGDELPVEGKKPWLSKSVWFGALTAVISAVAYFYPPIQALVGSWMPALGVAWGVLAVVLRLISKDKIVLVD